MADIDEVIRSSRIITGGILMSLVAMAAMAAFLRPQIASSFTSEVQNALLGLSGLVAVGSAVAYFTLQRSIKTSLQASAQASRGNAEPLLGVLEPYRRLAILRAALVEAPGLLGLLTYLVGGSEVGLVLAAASIVLLASTMPSRESLQRFADGLRE